MPKATNKGTAYDQIIEKIFFDKFTPGSREVKWERSDIVRVAEELGLDRPKNLGDVIYTYRFRRKLPESIRKVAPRSKFWIIRLAGRSKYRFMALDTAEVLPNPLLGEIKIPEATPGVIIRYALTDEQALLALVRYNRLLDIFTGVSCYSLQSHLRTQIPGLGQIETDELYVGVDRFGAHYVFPIQAKGGRDKLGIVQIEQDYELCQLKFPDLISRPIGAQFVEPNLIALFEFEGGPKGISLLDEKHYRLVPSEDLSAEELAHYREIASQE
jgi:hypothetical protein